ncbi:helix-turn-helix domain-containing protein [Deinococcus sp. HMF7620]|uniref:Helix-turn-helix domain-containing protein n=1 Tax=Deinococcus arboris TaxID=2682977 RepID=A0A7C9LP22_9DEIO|nr:helix-turn-helix transcriptional regulator [Deinococcus arboris]MVN88517.1 helix-turn-helix domain-containing protein [Deinococcus arboris]
MSGPTEHTATLQAIGHRLRAAREQLGLNQDDFADRAGVHRSYVGMLEHGRRDFRISMLYRLAEAANLSVAALLGLEGDDESIGLPASTQPR